MKKPILKITTFILSFLALSLFSSCGIFQNKKDPIPTPPQEEPLDMESGGKGTATEEEDEGEEDEEPTKEDEREDIPDPEPEDDGDDDSGDDDPKDEDDDDSGDKDPKPDDEGGGSGSGDPEPEDDGDEGETIPTTYTITWNNWDGTKLTESSVLKGVLPSYPNPTDPSRPQEGYIKYTFAGWNPDLVVASCNATYTAKYNEEDLTPTPPTETCEHVYDNGNFTFENIETSINGTWTYTCTKTGCSHTKTETGTMFRKGSSRYGYDELGKDTTYGAAMQAAYRQLILRCEYFLDDTTTNLSVLSGTSNYFLEYNSACGGKQYNFTLPISNNKSNGDLFNQLHGKLVKYFVMDHPRYYFLSGGSVISYYYDNSKSSYQGNIMIKINESNIDTNYSFVLGSKRSSYEKSIREMEDELSSKIYSTDSNIIKYQKVNDFLVNRIDYLYESGEPCSRGYAHTMAGMASKEGGVCECYAKSYAYLCNYIGLEAIVINGNGIKNEPGYGHAWNYIKVDSKWYGVDVTWNDQGDYVYYEYFGQNSKIQEDHWPETDPYEAYTAPTLSSTNLTKPTSRALSN